MWAENRDMDQPRPKVPHVSSRAPAAPHCFRFCTAHSAAARKPGEPVSQGPFTSVSQKRWSITFEPWKASALIRCTVARSTSSAKLGREALFIPAIYFRMAFFLIQRTSVMRDRMDWPAVRAEADELRRGARTTADTYPGIRLVLQRLGDNHSHLASPETVSAHRAGPSVSPGLTVR